MASTTVEGKGITSLPPDTLDKLTISIDPKLKRQLKQVAAIRSQTMGDVIADAITPVIQQELGV